MTQREFILSLLGGIFWGPVAGLRGLTQPVLPAEGSKPTFALTATDGTAVTDQPTAANGWSSISATHTAPMFALRQ
jgi:hypothetical protein